MKITQQGWKKKYYSLVLGLIAFTALMNFKPSEPYLTDFLSCPIITNNDKCQELLSQNQCILDVSCKWNGVTCVTVDCGTVEVDACGNSDYYYCHKKEIGKVSQESISDKVCSNNRCYKQFSENTVNNQIYPWSTYAYLPFLLILSPFAEIISYRWAILIGCSGRVATRFLLLYGTSLEDMQGMQVAYALGTAAEEVLSAYVYRCVPRSQYQQATSYIRFALHLPPDLLTFHGRRGCCVWYRVGGLVSHILAGVLADLLVTKMSVPLTTLFVIAGASVCLGMLLGLVVIRPVKSCATLSFETVPKHRRRRSSWLYKILPNRQMPPRLSIQEQRETKTVANSMETNLNPEASTNPIIVGSINIKLSDSETTFQESIETPVDSSSVSSAQPPTPISPSPSHSSLARIRTFGERWRDMINAARIQLRCIDPLFRRPGMLALTTHWIVGNAVFQTIYDYEISMYSELKGDASWNGSMLSILLLAGVVGSLFPVWPLRLGDLNQTAHSLVVGVVSVTCSAATVVMVAAWSFKPTMGAMTVLFLGWFAVTVAFYARLATELKVVLEEQLCGASTPLQSPRPLSMDADGEIDYWMTPEETDNNPCGRNSGASGSIVTAVTPMHPLPPSRPHPSLDIAFDLSHHFPEGALQSQVPQSPSSSSVGDIPPSSAVPSVDAPYSLVLMGVVALNASLQILVQAVLFNTMELHMLQAFNILVAIFVVNSVVFCIAAVLSAGCRLVAPRPIRT